MKKILISWLGNTDLKAAAQMPLRPEEEVGDGPILGALKSLSFTELHLLHDQRQTQEQVNGFINWLTKQTTSSNPSKMLSTFTD